MELKLSQKLSELISRNQNRIMDNDTLVLTVDALVSYYQNWHQKELMAGSILDLQFMSLCAEITDYYNAFDKFLGVKKNNKIAIGDLADWINENTKAAYERFSGLVNEIKTNGKIDRNSIVEYFLKFHLVRKINEKLLIEQIRFASFHFIEMYRNGNLEECKNGLRILLKISKTAFPQTSNPYVFELLGFLNFWIGRSHRQTNFESARKYLRIAKENFTFASLTAQNDKKLSDFAKYQIQRIYFVNLSEARLRLIERNIPQSLVLVEPLVDVIPESDSFGKAYAKYVRGVCKRVLQGRLVDDAVTDLTDALETFLGRGKNPPFPRHGIKVVRELVISYILMGKIEEAKNVINDMDNLINDKNKDSKINRFAKLKDTNKWIVLKFGLLSRIHRKEAKICWQEAEKKYLAGDEEEYLRQITESKKNLDQAVEFAEQAVNTSDSKIPSVDSDLWVIKGEAYFYKGIYFDPVDARRKKNNHCQTTIDTAYQSFEKAIALNKQSTEDVITGHLNNSHENLELTAICLIYMCQIQFMKNNFNEGVRLISKYLLIEDEVHSEWVKELYETTVGSFVLLSMNQIETDFNRNPKRKKMTVYQEYLLKALSHKFKTDAEMAKYFSRKSASISRSLGRTT